MFEVRKAKIVATLMIGVLSSCTEPEIKAAQVKLNLTSGAFTDVDVWAEWTDGTASNLDVTGGSLEPGLEGVVIVRGFTYSAESWLLQSCTNSGYSGGICTYQSTSGTNLDLEVLSNLPQMQALLPGQQYFVEYEVAGGNTSATIAGTSSDDPANASVFIGEGRNPYVTLTGVDLSQGTVTLTFTCDDTPCDALEIDQTGLVLGLAPNFPSFPPNDLSEIATAPNPLAIGLFSNLTTTIPITGPVVTGSSFQLQFPDPAGPLLVAVATGDPSTWGNVRGRITLPAFPRNFFADRPPSCAGLPETSIQFTSLANTSRLWVKAWNTQPVAGTKVFVNELLGLPQFGFTTICTQADLRLLLADVEVYVLRDDNTWWPNLPFNNMPPFFGPGHPLTVTSRSQGIVNNHFCIVPNGTGYAFVRNAWPQDTIDDCRSRCDFGPTFRACLANCQCSPI